MYYLDENLRKLNRIFDQNSRKEYLRLDLNENPGGLPEDFIKETLKEVTPRLISEYPETLGFTETLASYLGTDIEHLCLVNGSSEGIRFIIEAFTSVNGKILGVVPTYAMFDVYSKMYGRKFTPIYYTEDMQMPIDNILNQMTEDTQLLILVNPNNPMGNVYSREEFDAIFRRANQLEITVLIDEAYHYFYEKSFMDYAIKYEHVFVTRTFSKLFSLAGLRLGYVVGWPKGIEMVQKLCTPHNVNAIAELFAEKLLKDEELVNSLIKKHNEGREYLEIKLNENGYQYKSSNGNFIFIKQKTDAEILTKRMKQEKGILIKTYNGIGMFGNCLRVTTAEIKYMKIFMDALLELDK